MVMVKILRLANFAVFFGFFSFITMEFFLSNLMGVGSLVMQSILFMGSSSSPNASATAEFGSDGSDGFSAFLSVSKMAPALLRFPPAIFASYSCFLHTWTNSCACPSAQVYSHDSTCNDFV